MNRPQLGQWMTVPNSVHKIQQHNETRFVTWRINPKPAMFIGWRTVHEGSREILTIGSWERMESKEVAFHHKQSKEVWLFVDNPRHKPFMVQPFNFCESEDNDGTTNQ